MVPLQAGDTEALGRAQLLKASLSGQLGNTRPLLQVGPSIYPSKANRVSQYVLECHVCRGCTCPPLLVPAFVFPWACSTRLLLAGHELQPRWFDHVSAAQLPSL